MKSTIKYIGMDVYQSTISVEGRVSRPSSRAGTLGSPPASLNRQQ